MKASEFIEYLKEEIAELVAILEKGGAIRIDIGTDEDNDERNAQLTK